MLLSRKVTYFLSSWQFDDDCVPCLVSHYRRNWQHSSSKRTRERRRVKKKKTKQNKQTRSQQRLAIIRTYHLKPLITSGISFELFLILQQPGAYTRGGEGRLPGLNPLSLELLFFFFNIMEKLKIDIFRF